jgi:hypothetical protein
MADRPAHQKYRGVMLPEGMTPELADRLEVLLCEAMDDAILPFELGIRCFEAMRETLESAPHELSCASRD